MKKINLLLLIIMSPTFIFGMESREQALTLSQQKGLLMLHASLSNLELDECEIVRNAIEYAARRAAGGTASGHVRVFASPVMKDVTKRYTEGNREPIKSAKIVLAMTLLEIQKIVTKAAGTYEHSLRQRQTHERYDRVVLALSAVFNKRRYKKTPLFIRRIYEISLAIMFYRNKEIQDQELVKTFLNESPQFQRNNIAEKTVNIDAPPLKQIGSIISMSYD